MIFRIKLLYYETIGSEYTFMWIVGIIIGNIQFVS